MRFPTAFVATLIASGASAYAQSRPDYLACVDTRDPPGCIARHAIDDGRPERDDIADAIVRHGLVDEVPRRSRLLVRVAREQARKEEEIQGALGDPAPERSAKQLARNAKPKVFLAAVALLTAARHQADPFADPRVRSLVHKAGEDPMISFLALDFWHAFIKSGHSFQKSVKFAGLGAIWRQVLADRERAPDYADEIAGWLAYYSELGDEPWKFWSWYAARPGLTANQKASTAAVLAGYFSAADEAERLIDAGGGAATDVDVSAVRASIAVIRLRSAYDAKAARLLVAFMFDEMSRSRSGMQIDDDFHRDALEKSGAVRELREIADEYLRRAHESGPGHDAMNWYAAASDCYRRAGDREKAREVARLGLPFVAEEVQKQLSDYHIPPGTSPRWMAGRTRGVGTAPVIALYRAGAIDEALKFGYLAGKDRFDNAQIAGEIRDPQWVIDDNARLQIWSMVNSAIASDDQAFRRQVVDALKKSCKAAYAQCDDDTLTHLGDLAASLGDEAEMKKILEERVRQMDKNGSDSFWAVRLAAEFAHAIELLHESRR